jgi:hypothetical protein
MKKIKYSKALTDKIVINVDTSKNIKAGTPEYLSGLNEVFYKYSEELENKAILLFDFYKLDLFDWKKLAMTLATVHVPGFKYKLSSGNDKSKKAGRKQKWGPFKLLGLYIDFYLKRKSLLSVSPRTKYSDANIAEILAKNEWKGVKAKTLANINSSEAKNSLFIKLIKQDSIEKGTSFEEELSDTIEIIRESLPDLIKVSHKLK